MAEPSPRDSMRDSPHDRKKEVGPRFEDVIAYASDSNGVIDLSKIQSLEGRFGYNGGRGCDVLEGPCSCGAWH